MAIHRNDEDFLMSTDLQYRGRRGEEDGER